MDRALIIFIKNPEAGKVKTRLAASVGNERALDIYLQLLHHTREVAQSVEAGRLLFYSSFIDEQDEWATDLFEKHLQEGIDLGDRMAAAFGKAFQRFSKVVIIGSDCKDLRPEDVAQAFDKLDTFDYVVGPATDGGYYLLGMRAFSANVFAGVPWSAPDTLDQTLSRMLDEEKSVFLLPELSDVDYLEDWEG